MINSPQLEPPQPHAAPPLENAAARQLILGSLQEATQPYLAAAFNALTLAGALAAWGRWSAVLALVGIMPLSYGLNVPLMAWLRRSRPTANPERLELVRLAGNLATTIALAALSRWNLAAWLYVVVYMVVGGMFGAGEAHRRALIFWAIFVPAALLLGAPPEKLAVVVVASEAVFLMLRAMLRCLTGIVDECEAQRRELEVAHTDLQKLHRAALAQEKLAGLGMLAAGIAHEINNPMAYVTSNVSSLLEDLRRERKSLSPALREYADDVLPATLDGIQRVNAIVADLRRFARGDQDELVEYDLNDEIRAAVRLAQSRLKNRCAVRLSLGDLPQLMGHPRQIAQVLVNLLVNASQAIRERGTIEIASRETPDGAVFSVRDDGCGMTEEVRRHLFQPFFTTKPLGEGTGLGLSVVHGIVSDHGGQTQVESAPGKGTCFTVALPASPPESLDTRAPTGTWRIDALMAANGGTR